MTQFQKSKAVSYHNKKTYTIQKNPLMSRCFLNQSRLLVHQGKALNVAAAKNDQLQNFRVLVYLIDTSKMLKSTSILRKSSKY